MIISTPSNASTASDPIPVFYCPQMSVKENISLSPSAQKPAEVVREWIKQGYSVQIIEPKPLSIDEISVAHNPEYVKGVLSCAIENGFGNTNPEVARSLPYIAGSVYEAAKFSAQNKKPAWSPSSGSHHAQYDCGEGFCTFNHVMISAILLIKRGIVKKVGIVDNDAHYSNGDLDIRRKLGLIDFIKHYSFGGSRYSPEKYLEMLPLIIESMKDVDVLYHNAGADAHIDDPMGAGRLTTEQMKKRDEIVYEKCRELEIGCISLLAGGYKRDNEGSLAPVLFLHNQTMEACISKSQKSL